MIKYVIRLISSYFVPLSLDCLKVLQPSLHRSVDTNEYFMGVFVVVCKCSGVVKEAC